MMAAIGVHDLSVVNGEFHFDMMETLMTALNEYRRAPGNPMEDAEKAARARDVLADASAFMEKVNAEKSGIIEKYIGKLNDILTKDQKAKVVLSAKAYESQHTGCRRAARRCSPKLPPSPHRSPPAKAAAAQACDCAELRTCLRSQNQGASSKKNHASDALKTLIPALFSDFLLLASQTGLYNPDPIWISPELNGTDRK